MEGTPPMSLFEDETGVKLIIIIIIILSIPAEWHGKFRTGGEK